jgi:hypothetical protein
MMRWPSLVAFLLVSPALFGASYSPDGDRAPTHLFWGDTHVHTSYSTGDANFGGANTVDPAVAYQFARGDVVTANNGMPVRIRKPLDFLVIADHAENLGVAASVRSSDPVLLASEEGRRLRARWEAFLGDPDRGRFRANANQFGEEHERMIWHRVIDRAEAYNDPGVFTAFIGYEWTSLGATPGVFANLHRVVVFKDGADKTKQIVPFSAYDSRDPEDLWRFFESYEATTAGSVMSIPHNPNVSNGEMFALTSSSGEPLTRDYAKRRSRFESLVEVTQLKGDSEAHPLLSPTDEHADFETWNSWAGVTLDREKLDAHICCRDLDWSQEQVLERRRGEYAREALKRGLALGERLGTNPFKFGLIGSTDSHTSFATADNDNFWGKYSNTLPSATRMTDKFVPTLASAPANWETAAAGYAAVWAEENTRDSLFAAMRRKEVYATTGPRMTVRFFGGWEYEGEVASSPELARIGYAEGVPMGGDLPVRPAAGGAPRFLIAALKDADGANLDRVQVIKGWVDSNGDTREQIYNVAASDGRKPRRDGSLKPVGSTVDVPAATFRNTIGAAELRVVWSDPDFDAGVPAFYYVRVLEIPTPRWTAYDAKYFGVDPIPEGVSMVSQERAYTSPIWYLPN